MKPMNVLFIMADEHNRAMMGNAGHPLVKTPHLDALAGRGTRFTSAYSNCPICVPARASIATGRYNHDIRYWDNATAYDGRVQGWGHRLQEEAIRVESIGKLHYRRDDDPLGFDRRQIPMYIKDGVGSLTAAIRDPMPPFDPRSKNEPGFAAKAKLGQSSYTSYDIKAADLACEWLGSAAKENGERPWVLFLSFLSPHYPLTVPEEFFKMYGPADMPDPKLNPEAGYRRHPWVEVVALRQPHANGLTPEGSRTAVAAYLGLCTFIDHQIGRVLDTLETVGLSDNTRVIYTSDHGENAGARGLWGKSVMYEESTGVPMILSGPDVEKGQVCTTPVSLIDLYPTIIKAVGLKTTDEEVDLPGRSLFEVASGPSNQDRCVFAQYHASASPTGGFMVRKGRYKYHYYVDYPPEFFDLQDDPEEERDLSDDPDYAEVIQQYQTILFEIINPEAADRQAKDDQNAIVEFYGGREKILRDKIGISSYTPAPKV
ncbi:MAG: sulfatase-like hydrolase/transferase [Pseudomonadota bacterium]|nr:sulfatase-like hydrolase/transferase [Pseudomonadota bacterium]